jgi:F0F1-type ATP synthase delta subunit
MKNKIKFLTSKNFEQFISGLKISDEQKKTLLDSVPEMNKEERRELLNTLKKIYILDLEEAAAKGKIQKNWEAD